MVPNRVTQNIWLVIARTSFMSNAVAAAAASYVRTLRHSVPWNMPFICKKSSFISKSDREFKQKCTHTDALALSFARRSSFNRIVYYMLFSSFSWCFSLPRKESPEPSNLFCSSFSSSCATCVSLSAMLAYSNNCIHEPICDAHSSMA